MIKKILSFFIVLSIFQLLASIECKSEDPKREREVIFTKVNYEINKNLMSMKLNLKNNTNGKPTVDIDAEVFVDIPNELYINNIISKRASELEYNALIKTGKISLCDFFKNPNREPFLKILLSSLDKFGHMIFNCPVKKGKYYLRDFYVEASTLPSFTPPGDYRIDFTVTRKEKDVYVQIYRMIWYATVTN